jgi:hypothetical protein
MLLWRLLQVYAYLDLRGLEDATICPQYPKAYLKFAQQDTD